MRKKLPVLVACLVLVGAVATSAPFLLRLSRSYLDPETHEITVKRDSITVDDRDLTPDEMVVWLQGHRWSPRMHRLIVGPAVLQSVPEQLSARYEQQLRVCAGIEPYVSDSCHLFEWRQPPSSGLFSDD